MVPRGGGSSSPSPAPHHSATEPCLRPEARLGTLLQLLESDLKVSVFPGRKQRQKHPPGGGATRLQPSLCQTSPGGLGQGCSQLNWEGLWQRGSLQPDLQDSLEL